MATPAKIPLKMKPSAHVVKIPLKMKQLTEVNYSKLFYEAKLNTQAEVDILSQHLASINEIELVKISAHYAIFPPLAFKFQIANYPKDLPDDEWDPQDRLAQKCELYREALIKHLHPHEAVSLGLKKKYNQLYGDLFELWCDYDSWNENLTIDSVVQFLKGLPSTCPHCHSDQWMKSTYFDDTSIVCGKCENDVASLLDLHKLAK